MKISICKALRTVPGLVNMEVSCWMETIQCYVFLLCLLSCKKFYLPFHTQTCNTWWTIGDGCLFAKYPWVQNLNVTCEKNNYKISSTCHWERTLSKQLSCMVFHEVHNMRCRMARLEKEMCWLVLETAWNSIQKCFKKELTVGLGQRTGEGYKRWSQTNS